VPVDQNAQFVHAFDNLLDAQNFVDNLLAARAKHFVQTEHHIIAGVVSVAAVQAIRGRGGITDSVIVWNADRFVTRDQIAKLRPRRRAPCIQPRDCAEPIQPDRNLAALGITVAVVGKPRFMRASAQLCGLKPLRDETFDAPGIHEGASRARQAAGLRVTPCDMHALDAKGLQLRGPT
jgi:hypothetical protein